MPKLCGDTTVVNTAAAAGGLQRRRPQSMQLDMGTRADIINILWCPAVLCAEYMKPLKNPNRFYRNDCGGSRFRLNR
jgi:hypothetical protein